MKASDPKEWHRLFNAALNDDLSAADKAELAELLKSSAEVRQLWFLYHDNECSFAEMPRSVMSESQRPHPARRTTPASSFQWRSLGAAAAGLVFGLICSTVVFGYVTERDAIKKTAMPVFDPGLEGIKPLDTGLPHNVNEWGVRSAQIVTAEHGVQPLQGQRMLKLEPSLLGKNDENLYAHAYQVLDLRLLPSVAVSENREVLVSASFCAALSKSKAKNYIRVFALNEPPGTATEDFWSKAENNEVVSLTQRFEIEPGDTAWHPVSAKMPLPSGTQSLVIVFSATAPRKGSDPAPASYLDEVNVSLLTSPNASIQPP
jgi:hypothetical protein